MLRVGLTGGLASGKSTVARLLAERGAFVVDADRLVADLYRPGGAGEAVVRDLFGDEVFDSAGRVSHARLAERVFADRGRRRALEETIHPLVRRRFHDLVAGREGIVVLEATLLVEAGYAPDFDVVVSVEAPRVHRLARAMARGLDREAALARLDAQADGAARRRAAHRVLENDGSLEDLEGKVEELVRELRSVPESTPQPPAPRP